MKKEKSILADVALRIVSIRHANSQRTAGYIPFSSDNNLQKIDEMFVSTKYVDISILFIQFY